MTRKPCKCCQDGQPGVNGGGSGYGFNRLEGEVREWAKDNKLALSEHCVPVKDGNRFGGASWQKRICGDGRMGFSTRRKGQEDVHMEVGLSGQLKKKRHSLVRSKSSRATTSRRARRIDGTKCGLVSSVQIRIAQRDPIVVAQQVRESKKMKRAANRNNGARRGQRRRAA